MIQLFHLNMTNGHVICNRISATNVALPQRYTAVSEAKLTSHNIAHHWIIGITSVSIPTVGHIAT